MHLPKRTLLGGGLRCGIAISWLILGSCSDLQDEPASETSDRVALSLAEARPAEGRIWPDALLDFHGECASEPYARRSLIFDEQFLDWYSEDLGAFGETPLVDRVSTSSAGEQFALRFMWFPTFDATVVINLFENDSGQLSLEAKKLRWIDERKVFEIEDQIDRALSDQEHNLISQTMTGTALLEQPSDDCLQGLDGSSWIVEVIDDRTYYFIKRFSPTNGPVRESGELLLDLTGWQFRSIY